MAESLHREATPYTLSLRAKRPDTITPAVELITQDIPSAFLPASHMWTKPSGLPVIDGSYRLPPNCCLPEQFINLAHGWRTGRFRCHIPQNTIGSASSNLGSLFYDPVVLAGCGKSKSRT